MIETNIDGEWKQWRYKKLVSSSYRHYAFYVGDIYVGQLIGKSGNWSVVSKTPADFMPVFGFRTRYDASKFLMTFEGFIKEGR